MTKKPLILCLGEILWDLLPAGKILGGAPANVARMLNALNGNPLICSRVGNDPLGREILDQLRSENLSTKAIQIDNLHPTSVAGIELKQGIPTFQIFPEIAWDYLEWSETMENVLASVQAICFGTLSQRHSDSRRVIQKALQSVSRTTLRFLDLNLRKPDDSIEVIDESLRFANALKLNESELAELQQIYGLTGSQRDQLDNLIKSYHFSMVGLTRGAEGSLLYHQGDWHEFKGYEDLFSPIDFAGDKLTSHGENEGDTIGAGDAFTAAMILGWCYQLDVQEIHTRAELIARYACTQSGAVARLPEHMQLFNDCY